jgi:hypothetical protein
MGRFKSLQEMYLGVETDPGLAAYRADVASLRNMIINLRTGAAMSEPEAKRILSEVVNDNLPPSTFMERLANAKRDYSSYLQKRSRLGFGRNSPGEVDKLTGTTTPQATPTGRKEPDYDAIIRKALER